MLKVAVAANGAVLVLQWLLATEIAPHKDKDLIQWR